jgi:3-methyladenine DNA glycosylase/8-oxoguanine DNA glycosylase
VEGGRAAGGELAARACAEVRPKWPFALPRQVGADGLTRRRPDGLVRALGGPEGPAVVHVRQLARDLVRFEAMAPTPAAAEHALGRMRFAVGVDDDLRDFFERFRWDPVIGPLLRRDPRLRVQRRPEPFEVLAFAVCEQLVDYDSAAAIQRGLVARYGGSWPALGLRGAPQAAAVAAAAPAELEACGLSAARALALRRAAQAVAEGRIDLHGEPERSWRALRAIPGIGAWTVETLALRGQGRFDQVPAGDLGLLKLVGRARAGHPGARAQEDEVREVFAPYAPYGGLAAYCALRAGSRASESLREALRRPSVGRPSVGRRSVGRRSVGRPPVGRPPVGRPSAPTAPPAPRAQPGSRELRSPRPGGTRSSAPGRRSAAA